MVVLRRQVLSTTGDALRVQRYRGVVSGCVHVTRLAADEENERRGGDVNNAQLTPLERKHFDTDDVQEWQRIAAADAETDHTVRRAAELRELHSEPVAGFVGMHEAMCLVLRRPRVVQHPTGPSDRFCPCEEETGEGSFCAAPRKSSQLFVGCLRAALLVRRLSH